MAIWISDREQKKLKKRTKYERLFDDVLILTSIGQCDATSGCTWDACEDYWRWIFEVEANYDTKDIKKVYDMFLQEKNYESEKPDNPTFNSFRLMSKDCIDISFKNMIDDCERYIEWYRKKPIKHDKAKLFNSILTLIGIYEATGMWDEHSDLSEIIPSEYGLKSVKELYKMFLQEKNYGKTNPNNSIFNPFRMLSKKRIENEFIEILKQCKIWDKKRKEEKEEEEKRRKQIYE